MDDMGNLDALIRIDVFDARQLTFRGLQRGYVCCCGAGQAG